jgi:hypothetical protein
MFLLDAAVPDAQTEDLDHALVDLTSVSLVMRDTEGERFAVHRLVQDVTRCSLDAAASRQRLKEALGWVNAAFTGNPQDVRSWARLDPLAPHALSATQWADSTGITEPTMRLINHLGCCFRQSRCTRRRSRSIVGLWRSSKRASDPTIPTSQ